MVTRRTTSPPAPDAGTAEHRSVGDPAPRPGEALSAPRESRSERRAAVVRAGLEPLGPGEYPVALRVTIVLTALLGLGNLLAYALGVKISGRHPGPGVLSFSVVMGLGCYGLVLRRYWAVLAAQALIALTIVYFCLLLIIASNIEALVVCVAVIAAGSWLFWKLVRVLARIQTPVSR